MTHRFIKLLLFFIAICELIFSQNVQKNVLFLNSYHQGYAWTDKVTSNILRELSKDTLEINTFVEYMDTKRIKPDSIYFLNYSRLLEYKYSKIKFDVIISCDDDAFYFLLRYRDLLFKNIPVIASGLGKKNQKKIQNSRSFFPVYDDFKEMESLYKSLSLLPFVKNVVFIADQTTTGISSLETMRDSLKGNKYFKPFFISDDTLSNIIKEINSMSESTAIVPLIFNYDKSGKFYSHTELAQVLTSSTHFPVLATTEDQIGAGALGGMVHSVYQHSKIAAEMALRLLHGESFSSLNYSIDSLSVPIYDYKLLDYYGINPSSLPANAIIINKPVSYYEQNKFLILLFSLTFVVLISIIVIISINIFKRRQAEVKLKKLSLAVEQSPVSIIITNTEGIMEYVNPQYCRITGYTYEESIGNNPRILKSDITSPVIFKELWKTISAGLPWRGEICNKKKDGTLFWELVAISPVIDASGRVTHFVSVKEDVTERKVFERNLRESKEQLETTLKELKLTQNQVIQQERLRSIGQMASGIAHDINNSLMPILGYADLLLYKKKLDPDTEKKINSIRTASLDIKRTIERMRDFYKPKIDHEEFESVSVDSVVNNAIEFTQHRWKDMAESRGVVISINVDIEENLPFIQGNESELREALINLVLNASDAMPKGGNILLKSFTLNEEIVIELKDTGIGMDEETLKHCFDPFYTTKGERGTGLGLSMVYGIIQRHRGTIEIISKQGQGTTVTLKFHQGSALKKAKMEGNNYSQKVMKILCIDDSEDARELIGSILNHEHHEAVLVDSGAEGLKVFFGSFESEQPFDIVITDLGMPFMDGKSVSEAIKSKSPKTPVILMTGWGAFLEPGSIKSVDYILKKPVTIEEFNKALTAVSRN